MFFKKVIPDQNLIVQQIMKIYLQKKIIVIIVQIHKEKITYSFLITD
ncbi:unnamed protein product [Paramecium sonneborni]|uniref:Uncharacterized protein n=1 Tax=Paramecium sonneborni TaxID=65129 RepID=A0A8S1LFX7_9CILI|nr:unnamed protein product [Paramecium sonneborni]